MSRREVARLFKKGLVAKLEIYQKITEESAEFVHHYLKKLREKGCPDLEIVLRCQGGNIDPSLHIYDDLRHYPGRKRGLAVAFVYSSAVNILQACDERHSYEHAKFLIHEAAIEAQVTLDDFSPGSVKSYRFYLNQASARMCTMLANHTGRSEKIVRREMRKDTPMTAKEALKFGLIDKIIKPPR